MFDSIASRSETLSFGVCICMLMLYIIGNCVVILNQFGSTRIHKFSLLKELSFSKKGFFLFSLLGLSIFKNNASSYIQTPNHK